MDNYIDYLIESKSAILYFTCTAAFFSVIITCGFSQQIYWDRAGISILLWIIPTIFHIKRFTKYCQKLEQ